MSWHSARLDGKTVSGTDFGDRMGRGSGQFAASALDTLSAACNRDTGKPALSRTRVGGLREWERALRPFGVSLSFAIQKISVMSVSYDAEAKRKGFDLRRLQFKLFGKLRLGSYPRRSHRVSAGAHCPSDCQPFWQFAVPGIAEVTSPAGIARKPDSPIQFRCS